MIEIEKNFDLKSGDKERIIKDAKFIGRRQFTDVYYDTQDYKLTISTFSKSGNIIKYLYGQI